MKAINTILLLFLLATVSVTAGAQEKGKVDFSVVAGANIGGTSPMGLPEEIRGINSFNPTFNPAVGVKLSKMLSNKWGIGAGLMYERKGMKTGVDVRNYHLTLNIQDGDELSTKTGYYTGSIRNTTHFGMLTLPVYAVYQLSENWQLTGGAYVSMAMSREFIGKVSGGHIRETPLTPLVGIRRADYDYSDDLNELDCGVSVGAMYRVWKKLSVEADLKWGCLNMLNSEKRKVDMNTYNIYLFLGLNYSI